MQASVSVRIDLPDGQRIGPGKIRLLERIEETGSISAAGRSMGMSYKRAWSLIDTLNRMFEEPVVASRHGGAQGGGAGVTPFGSELIQAYLAVEAQAKSATAARLGPILGKVAKPRSGAGEGN